MDRPECGIELSAGMMETGICYGCGFVFRGSEEQIRLREERQIQIDDWNLKHPDADGRYYEYRTIRIRDKMNGQADIETIETTLNRMGYDGWRSVSTFTNEVGRQMMGVEIGSVAIGSNSTIDETILIFERAARIDQGGSAYS